MKCPSLADLPSPPSGKTGWPWDRESCRISKKRFKGKSWPRISVVTPSFNQSEYLEETIRSVLLQGYPDLEYIIIDGGSSDNSVEIIKKYEPWLAFWKSEPDKGQANGVNKGFKVSTGQIMGWLNSDDCLYPESCRRIAEKFLTDNSCDIVCGFREEVNATTNKRYTFRAHFHPDRYTLSRSCYIHQETVYWKRDVWKKIGGLDETFHYALDYEYWQRMLNAGYSFKLIPCVIGIFKIHNESKGKCMDDVRDENLKRIYRKYVHTEKTEQELRDEISSLWWHRREILIGLGNKGLFRFPFITKMIVSFLTVSPKVS